MADRKAWTRLRDLAEAAADPLDPMWALLDAVAEPAFVYAANGEFLRANEHGRRVRSGLPAEVIAELESTTRRRIQQYVTSGDHGPQMVELAPVEGDVVRSTLLPVVRGTGEVLGYVVTAKNITDVTVTAGAVSARVGRSADQLAEVSDALLRVSRQTTDRVTAAAGSTEELRTSFHEIARSASTAAETSVQAVAAVQESMVALQDLVEASDEIGNFVKLINSVANQTKLLALNATIEAARAGEAGRGFSIVAAEVKELATTTSANSEDINQRVNAIRGATHATGTTLGRLRELIDHLSDVQAAMASSMEQQAAAAAEIAHAVHDISQGAIDTAERVELIRESSALLRTSVDELADLNKPRT